MSDLIDREAMLKHIEKTRQGALMMDDIREASIVMTGMYMLEEAVRNQPSVQPNVPDMNVGEMQEGEDDAEVR